MDTYEAQKHEKVSAIDDAKPIKRKDGKKGEDRNQKKKTKATKWCSFHKSSSFILMQSASITSVANHVKMFAACATAIITIHIVKDSK
jgi:hypothetical protein